MLYAVTDVDHPPPLTWKTVDDREKTAHSSSPRPTLGQVEAVELGEPRPGQELEGGGGAHQGLGDPHIGPEGGAATDVVQISAGQEETAEVGLNYNSQLDVSQLW